MTRTKAIRAACVLLLSSGSAEALAQASSAAPNSEERGLDAIIVTAERRDQSLQDVPISATVLTGEDLNRQGVADLNDIQQVAPSIAINTFNRSTFVNIRGVGIAQSAPTSNPGVAYYIDGQLIPHEQFIGQSFYDIATIEVLRGPQGTLTGQNSTGGAIYVRTPEPEFDQVSGVAEFTAGSYDHYRAVGAINIGTEDVALRLAAVHEERGSFTRNIGPSDSEPGNSNLDSVRANLRLLGLDGRLNLYIRGEYFDSRSDNNAVKNRDDLTGNDPALRDPFVISEDAVSYMNQEGYRVSSEARYDLTDSVQVRGLVSWQNGDTRDQTDGDRSSTALPVPAHLPTSGANTRAFPGRVSNAVTTFETLLAEVNLLSTGSGPLQWVLGAFIMDESVPVTLLRDNRSTLDFVSSNSDIVTEAHNNSRSLFGQANYFVTDKVEVVAGVRYSWDSQNYIRYALPGPPRDYPVTTDPQESSTLTGKLAVNLHLDDVLLYASAAKGFKAGGVNLDPALGNFGPETNYVYELGFKSEVIPRRLRINGTAFYSDYRDIQLASLVSVGGGPLLPQTQNAASGKALGGELEVTAQFGGFGANLGVGYLDGQFSGDAICINNTNDPLGNFPTPTLNPCTAGNAYIPDGARLPYAPEWTINAGAQYEFLLSDALTLTPRIQWSHISTQYVTPFQSERTIVPGRDVFDARLSLEIRDRYEVEAFASNFTDETYVATQIQNSSSADGGIIYGAPATYGLRVRMKFGD